MTSLFSGGQMVNADIRDNFIYPTGCVDLGLGLPISRVSLKPNLSGLLAEFYLTKKKGK